MFGIDDAIGGVAGFFGGLLGEAASAEDRKKALQANQQALQQWLDIHVPDPEKQKIALQRFVVNGELTPDLEQAVKQGDTNLNKIQVDPDLKGRQLKALSSLEDISSNGGMSLVDQANEQKRINDINAMDRGKRGAIADNFAARGLGGTGLELSGQLDAAQDATSRANEASLNTTASARQRALDAIMGGGQLAGSMRSQDYGEQKDKFGAQDAIDRFNTTNLQSVQQRNVNRTNQAQATNLERRQAVGDKNVGIANQEEIHNKELGQRDFENQMSLAGKKSAAYGTMADSYSGNANRTAGQFAGAGDAIGRMGTASAQNRRNNDLLDRYFGAQKPQAQPLDMSGVPEGTTALAGGDEDEKKKYRGLYSDSEYA